MKQVLIQGGGAIVAEVPAPYVGKKNILVRVTRSCISVGTEIAGVRMSGMPLYKRALKQPENVKRVLDMVRDQGLKRTMDRVTGKLAAGSPTGYSAAGVVIEIGSDVQGFAVGDRVACAGAGIANHAEIIDVPVNLAVHIPAELDDGVASTVTLGAIALQGVRRASPTLGETFVVVGLGILGQLTVQMLSANGCRVIGVDLDAARIARALENGMDAGVNLATENYVERIEKYTAGVGADGVIVTAATSSHQVISDAMQACRKKGRVVLVGDVGLNLNRADFYKKELDFFISSSYGPGRYDASYEEGGIDYPLPYVRWTENRNMQAYLDLLSTQKIKLETLSPVSYDVADAAKAYDALKGDGEKPLLALLTYSNQAGALSRRVEMRSPVSKDRKINVAIAGASSFAQGMHLPNLVTLRKSYEIHAVMSRTGANARAVATQYSAAYCTSDYDEILNDEKVDLVLIATRHNLHADMVLKALRAGKNVFVEKPLALNEKELREIEEFYEGVTASATAPILMTGFNRRFSPAIKAVQEILRNRTTPLIVNYRMNAGFIPKDHWVQSSEGGGRNIGEACHIYDLFNALVGGKKVISVHAESINPANDLWCKTDNFIATVKYEDGSICSLTYTAMGSKSYPKERMEVFVDGRVVAMDDYMSVAVHGAKHPGWKSNTIQKGQTQELEALALAFSNGQWPISLEEQLQATRISLEVEKQITK